MTLLIFALWITLHSLLINLGCKIGWNYDPGYIGPAFFVISTMLMHALYTYAPKRRTESES